MVISWILNSVIREIVDSLMYFSTAHEIWTDLRDRFHQSNAPHIFQWKRLLTGTTRLNGCQYLLHSDADSME